MGWTTTWGGRGRSGNQSITMAAIRNPKATTISGQKMIDTIKVIMASAPKPKQPAALMPHASCPISRLQRRRRYGLSTPRADWLVEVLVNVALATSMRRCPRAFEPLPALLAEWQRKVKATTPVTGTSPPTVRSMEAQLNDAH